MIRTDFLVIGSGIAGLTFAIKTAKACPDKTILVVTKTNADETNTKYAQGGIAVVNDLENDSFEKHIEDTLIAGDGLCNEEVVEIVVKEGADRVNEIIDWVPSLTNNPTVILHVVKKVDIVNTASCITKMLPVLKWSGLYWIP